MASDAVSVPPPIKYEVFVNFRGTDTRKSFTSHLKEALDRNGINAFTDSGLEAGEEISTTLDSRITESLVSVVVFSPNYADSRWCLDELVRIMECKEANNQTVLPVFLQGVEPTHVRKQIGAFGEGFGRLIQDARFADRKASWERALKEAADLSGHATDQMSEGEIVNKLINRVQSVLSKRFSIDLDKRFIVMKHVEIVESSMFASEQQWRCLGLWGMGGSGKTTLAKEIQMRVSNHFEGSCFVEKVGKLAERGKLNKVYWKQMSQLLKMNDDQDVPTIQRKLRITKVLIILDDVSDADQCQERIGDWSSHCPGSKMIAISRDKQILRNIGCDQIYEVKALDDHESLQLLKHHILKQREPTPDQMGLLTDAIKYTGGLPLALKVLGRNLFDKDITIWKSELAKLGDKPNLDIMKILKTSFDGLDDDEKNIFLDIACFMNGWAKDRVESMIDACGFHAISGIDRLADKALLTITENTIHMHDLLQQMGKDIGSGSRLCGEKEIADIFTRRNQGRKMEKKIEVMSMEVTRDTSMKLSPGVFKKMTRLRILRFEISYFRRSDAISFPEGLKYLPDGLRYFKWDKYPEQSLPPRFNPENLVELRMTYNKLRQLWTGEIEPYMPSLKHVDLSGSFYLATIPNFKNSLNLETLRLTYCRNLKDIPNLSQLTKLVELHLADCSEFRILRQLPPSLIVLNLNLTKIKKLENTSIQGLSQLEHLFLDGCDELESLPDNICVLKNLGGLNLEGCRKLSTLPSLQMPIIQGSPSENLPAAEEGLRSLRMLYFPGYNGETLPSLKSLVSLKELQLQGSNVKSLPEDIKYLTNLWKIDVSECENLNCIPKLPPSLIELNLSFTKIKKLENTSIEGLSQLEHLGLNGCEELESLPDNICVLRNIGMLDFAGCQKLLTLPSLQMPIVQGSPSEKLPTAEDGLRSLRSLNFPWYKGEILPSLKSLVSLRELQLQGSHVKSLPEDIKYLTNLWKIDVSKCRNLNFIPELPTSLLYLDASDCTSLQKYTHLSHVESLPKYTHLSHRLRMMFRNCFSLEKEARNVIWRDLRLRNQSIFIPLLETGRYKYSWLSPIDACIPGNEVPEWFKYSDTGPSTQVNTNRLHHNGLYIFVVIRVPTYCIIPISILTVTCKGYGESGETFDSSCKFYSDFDDMNMQFESEHTIVWYHHLGSHNNQFYLNGATFHFSAELRCRVAYMDGGSGDDSGKFVIKMRAEIVKCGVMPFYNNDDEGDNSHGDDNDDGNDEDYNNNGRKWGSSSSILLAEEEPGDACDLDLIFPAPVEEGQGASGFDLNFEDDLDLDLGFAPPAEERDSLGGNEEEEEPHSHERNNKILKLPTPIEEERDLRGFEGNQREGISHIRPPQGWGSPRSCVHQFSGWLFLCICFSILQMAH